MDKQECDKDIETPIGDAYKEIVCRHDDQGENCIGMIGSLISANKRNMLMQF